MQRLAGLGFLCLKGGTCSSPEARGLARAIWPQPWVQGLPERIQGAVCQHGKTYGTAQDGQDEGDHPTGTLKK